MREGRKERDGEKRETEKKKEVFSSGKMTKERERERERART